VSDSTAAWERAYLRFETPEQEARKFRRRFRAVGAQGWSREALILDLFSGRGGGARALRELGFSRVISLDLSAVLLQTRTDVADCSVADCRTLPIATGVVDIVVVQGGLHHLPTLPADLASVANEVARALKPDGIFVVIEPWNTLFLDLVHAVSRWPLTRKLYKKLDVLRTMIELERETYEQWLSRGPEILAVLDASFVAQSVRIGLGKLKYVGRRRSR
jgi:SAM-dependent methyltransferase